MASTSVPQFEAIPGPPDHDRVLRYASPAAEWDDALPIGNGRVGAMVFGRPGTERLQLNEETLWAGGHVDRTNPEAAEHLGEVRRLLFEGEHARAESVAETHLLGDPERIRPYQTLGDLELHADEWAATPERYERWLDLRAGTAGVEYAVDGGTVRRECFVSHADDLLALRIESDGPISVTLSADRPQDARSDTADDDRLRLRGGVVDFPDKETGPGGWGVRFEAQARIRAEGGETTAVSVDRTDPNARQRGGEADRPAIRVEGADAVTVLATGATDAGGGDPAKRCGAILDEAADRSYADLRERHVAAHRPKMDRVAVDLGTGVDAPTDERVRAFGEAADPTAALDRDPDLAALSLQYGRYLLLGSSQPGGLPANLQGIWNGDCYPPWQSDFHLNINLQMNYWPAEVANLPECVDPLVDFVDDLRPRGREVASEHYDCDGFVAHHVSDAWGTATPVYGALGIWPVGAAWCCQHLYERYRFDRDPATLERVYPIMREAAAFLLDYLVEDDGDHLVTAPSTSPENRFVAPDGSEAHLCVMPTMDRFVVRELFENCIAAAEELDRDASFRSDLADAVDRLPEPRIGRHGQLQEWRHDHDEVDPGHRHLSHLYGFHPGEAITLRDDPELADAVRTSIDRRLEHGGGEEGWSRAWLTSFAARFEDGNAVAEHLAAYLGEFVHTNLFNTAHGETQVDGTFGAAAGITEALLGSHGGELRLLPALPAAWSDGSVAGLRARGGFEVDLDWSGGTLDRATVRSTAGERCRVRTFGVTVDGVERDGSIGVDRPEAGIVAFDTEAGGTYELTARDA
jgi:alpha-L-fucosidase 2